MKARENYQATDDYEQKAMLLHEDLQESKKLSNTFKYLLTCSSNVGAIIVDSQGRVSLAKSLEQLFKLADGQPTVLEGYFETGDLKFLDIFPSLEELSRDHVITEEGVVPGMLLSFDLDSGDVDRDSPQNISPTVRTLKWLDEKEQRSTSFEVGGHDIQVMVVSKLTTITLPRVNVTFHVREVDKHEFVVLIHNETPLQQKNAELQATMQQLRETQDQLVQSEKMVGIGILASGVTHEINNPVNFIQSGSENVEAHLKELKDFIFEIAGDDASDTLLNSFETRFNTLFSFLETIHRGSIRIKTIVTDLKTFSHVNDSEHTLLHVVPGIMSAIRLAKLDYKDQVEFVCELDADPKMKFLPAEMNQVFMNVILNACQAIVTKQESDKSSARGQLHINTILDGNQFVVSFKDTGCGMPKTIQNKIFDPFFTTRPVGAGTGLGLYIVYRVVKQHNGDISVESDVNQGTTVKISLPI